jgi:hypothetical protein
MNIPEVGTTERAAPSVRDSARAFLSAVRRVDALLGWILLLFLAVTVPRAGAVPMWDSRIYYDGCLMPALAEPADLFDLLKLNCFGHPSMLYMILLAPGQLLSPGSAVLLNLTNIGLGCLAIGAFWAIAAALLPGPAWRRERCLATGLFAVWPAAVGTCLNMTPDYGVLVFFLLTLALLLGDRVGAAALAGLFLVLSKESGVLLYGALLAIFSAVVFFQRKRPVRERWRDLAGRWILGAPAGLYVLVFAWSLTRNRTAVWGGSGTLARTLKRFVFFDPAEIFVGPYGPAIWVLSFSWILTIFAVAAAVRLSVSGPARAALRSLPISRRTLICLSLLFAAVPYILTRFETYTNVRYLLPIAPLLILAFLISLSVLFSRPLPRQAILGITLVLLLASDFRTLDPISRAVWGTFPFGKHDLLRMTSWMNECCGYSRDQLVYNLEYLKIDQLQSAVFHDIRPTVRTALVADPMADWFLAGRITPDGARSLKMFGTTRVHYVGSRLLESRRPPPETAYFVAFPNFDNGPEFQRLRRHYQVTTTKSYEIGGYGLPVTTLRRKPSPPPRKGS